MSIAKPIRTTLASHFRLSKDESQTEEEKDSMANIPYALFIGSMMYTMVYTRPNIDHAIGVVRRFILYRCKLTRRQLSEF